jgi:multisubunit Na+/H+ antiporter MnhE subunit
MGLHSLGLHGRGLLAGIVIALIVLYLLRRFETGWLATIIVAILALLAGAYGGSYIETMMRAG